MEVVSFTNVGPPNTPQEVKRARRNGLDMYRFHGQPVVHMHKYTLDDYNAGVAKRCTACWDSMYGNVRNDCPICFGVGYVSVETNINGTYLDINGRQTTDPSTGVLAPRYGGYGQRTITWVIEPDKAVDVFKLDSSGALVKVQNADAFAPWYPTMADNDLVVNVQLNPGATVAAAHDRFILKMVTPQSLRGWGKRQQSLRQDEYLIGQQFEMTLIQQGTILNNVPIDPDTYLP